MTEARDLPIDQAAVALGISEDALRLRLRRGKTISGYKRDGRWYVRLPAADATDATTDATTDASGRDQDATRTRTTRAMVMSTVMSRSMSA